MAPNLRGLVPHKKGEIGTHRQIPIMGRQHEDTQKKMAIHKPNQGERPSEEISPVDTLLWDF